jgi:hypothetical protein
MHSITNEKKLKISCSNDALSNTFLSSVNHAVLVKPSEADIIISPSEYPDYSTINLQDKWYDDGFPFWLMTDAAQFIDQSAMLSILNSIAMRHDNIAITPNAEFNKSPEFDLFIGMHKDKEFDLILVNGLGEKIVDTGVLNDLVNLYSDLRADNSNVLFGNADKYLFRLKRETVKVNGFYSLVGKVHHHAFSKRVDKPIKDFIQMVFDGCAGAFTLHYYYDVNKFFIHKLNIGVSSDLISTSILSIPEVKNTIDAMSTRYVYAR